MRRLTFPLSCLLALLFALGAAASTKHWELVTDKDGIKVWVLEIPGQDLPGFRGVTSMNASIEEIVDIVLDVKRHTEWQWNCLESREVGWITETSGLLYNKVNAPWPIWDRDVLLHVAWRYTPNKEALTFRFKNVEDPRVPPENRVVRMPRLEGFFRLWQSNKPNVTNVLYQVEVDIAGNVPDFLARRYARKLPYETLDALREIVDETVKKKK